MSIAEAKLSATAMAQVDVFTDEPYTGNPAAVCILDHSRDDIWMSRVAREMGCPNTAFVQRRSDGGDGLDLRWFTAGGVEVDLCGHATLATAHVLYERKALSKHQPARFYTRSGVLTAWIRAGGGIEMDFPLEIASPSEPPPALLTGLGAEPVWVGRNRLDYVVEVASEDVLRSLKPDLNTLARIETRGFVVTARAGAPQLSRYDYVLRFFGPRVGIPEDMVTGTAHCALAPYWRDRFADGRTMFTAFQASHRGGFVSVRIKDDRVMIGGKAVTVLHGKLLA
jgi:predicted PhzF superfamily epimerase YddE/YHI9